MNLPLFDVHDDPGPSFTGLLKSQGFAPEWPEMTAVGSTLAPGPGRNGLEITHGTTVVATRYADGVVVAGDRRATSGNLISHRNMRKVFPADRWSAVSIAGAAGPAMEMVKLFQLQLEHYEKVEGHELSLEGKANQLSQMVRAHLPAAMSGMVVVPLFAGYDRRRNKGRLFAYDVTGGRYEEDDYVASGSGSLHARTVIKLGFSPDLTETAAIDLVIHSLFTAAEEDSATGGPDAIRGIYPIVTKITSAGYDEIDEDDVVARFEAAISSSRERLS